MADAAAVTPVSGLKGDPLFSAVQASLNALIGDVTRLRMRLDNRLATTAGTWSQDPNITNGTTAGYATLGTTITYLVAGVPYQKSSSTNLWDTTALSYNATLFTGILFLLSAQGTGSITHATSTTAAAAMQSVLYKHTDPLKALVGVFVASAAATFGNSTLTAQGTFYAGGGAQCQFSAYQANWG